MQGGRRRCPRQLEAVRLVAHVALAVALAGCGKQHVDDVRTRCADAAKKGVAAMLQRQRARLATAPLPDDIRATMEERTKQLELIAPRLEAVFVNHCVDDRWPTAVIDCYAKAAGIDDQRTCRQLLPPDAQQKLQADEMNLVAGVLDPPIFMGSAGPGAIGPKPTQAEHDAAVAEANKLADDLKALGAKINDATDRVASAQNDADRAAAKAALDELAKQADELRTNLAAAQARAR